MKTPREILLEHHRQAEPKLDAIRRQALAALPEAQEADKVHPEAATAPHGAPTCSRLQAPWFQRCSLRFTNAVSGLQVGAPQLLRQAWRELIWPLRRAWAGMAALWLAVLAVNLEMKAAPRPAPLARSVPIRDVAQALAEQRRLLAELLPPVNPPPAQAPRPNSRPRSQGPALLKAC